MDCNNFSNGCQTVNVLSDNSNKLQSLVYPNPASNWLTVSVINKPTGNINIEIFDLRGKRIFAENKLLTNDNTLNVSSLSNGIYILKLSFSDGSTDVFKVSVNR